MQKIGLFEAKNRLSEIVERAERGEAIGITRRGKLAAVISPARSKTALKEVFEDIAAIRTRARLPRGLSVDQLIEEGRR
jgi:prevent-host-death family protein